MNPWIVTAVIEYKEGKRQGALEGWKVVASETEKNEMGTLFYGVCEDTENANVARTLGIYESESFFKDVHAGRDAVRTNLSRFGRGGGPTSSTLS